MSFRKKMIMPAAFTICSIAALSPARASVTLWYNGDYDNRDELTNESNVLVSPGVYQTAQVYDDFTVPAGSLWAVSSIFSNDQIGYSATPATATWSIRSGVTSGNGGTVIASGDSPATAIAQTAVNGFYYAYPQYRVTASIPTVLLTPGTYWLSVAPDSAGTNTADQSYIETTSGADAIGTPPGNDGKSYVTNTYPASGQGSDFFTPTTTALAGDGDGALIDFSMGVVGTSGPVPEPSTFGLLAIAGTGLLARRRRNAPGAEPPAL